MDFIRKTWWFDSYLWIFNYALFHYSKCWLFIRQVVHLNPWYGFGVLHLIISSCRLNLTATCGESSRLESLFLNGCWGPKCDKETHSMKSKEWPWDLTKEGPAREVKKEHEGQKVQKEGKRKKKVKGRRRRRGPKLRPWVGSPSSRKRILWGKS